MAKEHNDANILVIGARVVGKAKAREILKAWLTAKFAAGRHQRRLDKIKELEKK
ncbi:MAG: RpiB/LacA/LacB family sugar-phosphate isomerase [Deltaproteobacteria bacterium]